MIFSVYSVSMFSNSWSLQICLHDCSYFNVQNTYQWHKCIRKCSFKNDIRKYAIKWIFPVTAILTAKDNFFSPGITLMLSSFLETASRLSWGLGSELV
jgi:hypothetical protein